MSETPDQSPDDKTVPTKTPTPADVFGTVLPDQTGDERSSGDWRDDLDSDRDDELRADVPPHH